MPLSIFYSVFIGKIGATTSLPLTGPDVNELTLPGRRTLVKIEITVVIMSIYKPEEFCAT